MDTMNFTSHEFKKLAKMSLDRNVMNTEGALYVVPEKVRWDTQEKLLKFLYNDIGEQFSNKLFTINSLIDNASMINIDEIVMPEKLAIVADKVVGFVMPFIPNMNLQSLLSSSNITNENKINYFKQVGLIIEKMKNVRDNKNIKDFYINDLHEGNFILNINTNKINLVDIDSCKINGNKPFAAKYLTPVSHISEMPTKYKQNEESLYPGFIVANENSDLYCYSIMILNYLYQDRITSLNIEEFYLYMNYLRHVGLSYQLVDKFSKIYQYQDNDNFYEYLDYITPTILEKSNQKVFKMKTS